MFSRFSLARIRASFAIIAAAFALWWPARAAAAVHTVYASGAADHADPNDAGSIAWAFATYGGYQTYELAAGTFNIGSTLEVPAGATLRATSLDGVRIKPNASFVRTESLIRLSDYSTLIDVYADGRSQVRHIVDARDTRSAYIQGCVLRETMEYGTAHVVEAMYSSGLTIERSTLSYAGITPSRQLPTEEQQAHGLSCFHCLDLRVLDSHVNYTRTAGIFITGTLGAEIVGNEIFEISWNTRKSHVDCLPTTSGPRCPIWSSGDGITGYHNDTNPSEVDFTIRSNTIWGFSNQGIHVSGTGMLIADNEIDGRGPYFGHSALFLGDTKEKFPGEECSKSVAIFGNTLHEGDCDDPDHDDSTRDLAFRNYDSRSVSYSAFETGPDTNAQNGSCTGNHADKVLPVSPALYYEFRQGLSIDTTGHTTATANNGATVTIDSELGKVLALDGKDDFMRISNTASVFDVPAFSVLALVKQDVSGAMQIFSKDCSSCNQRSFQFRVSASGELQLIVFTGSTTYATATSPAATIQPGIWYLVVGTYDGATIAVYVASGTIKEESIQRVASTALRGRLNYATNDAFIGRSQTSTPGYFDGRIDDVAFFPRALSAFEIWEVYNYGHMSTPDVVPIDGLGF